MDLHFVTPSYTSGTKGLQRGHVLIEPRTQEELDLSLIHILLKIERDKYDYEVKLSNGWEIKFDMQFNVIDNDN